MNRRDAIRRVAIAIWDRQRVAVLRRSPGSLSAVTEFGGAALPGTFWEEIEADAAAAIDAMVAYEQEEIESDVDDATLEKLRSELAEIKRKALDPAIAVPSPMILTSISESKARQLVVDSCERIGNLIDIYEKQVG